MSRGLSDRMYPNPTRIMVCRTCRAERIVNTAGKTKLEVTAMGWAYKCAGCRAKSEGVAK